MKAKCFDCGKKSVMTQEWTFTIGVWKSNKLVAKPKQFCPDCTKKRQKRVYCNRSATYQRKIHAGDEE